MGRAKKPLLSFILMMFVMLAFGMGVWAKGYSLGPGDGLRLVVWGHDDLSVDVQVQPDGIISIPLVGEVSVTGLDISEASSLIQKKLSDWVKKPRVTITITKFRDINVRVLGEVKQQGLYPLKATGARLLDAIAAAGGILPNTADSSHIVVTHNDASSTVTTSDYEKDNPELYDGDIITIPYIDKYVTIDGEIQNPGRILVVSKSGTSLDEIIAEAGGPTQAADISKIQVYSLGTDGKPDKLVFEGNPSGAPRVFGGYKVQIPTKAITKVTKAVPYLEALQLTIAILAAILAFSKN